MDVSHYHGCDGFFTSVAERRKKNQCNQDIEKWDWDWRLA